MQTNTVLRIPWVQLHISTDNDLVSCLMWVLGRILLSSIILRFYLNYSATIAMIIIYQLTGDQNQLLSTSSDIQTFQALTHLLLT